MRLVIKNIDGTVFIENLKILSKDFRFSNILGSGQSGLNLQVKYSGFDLIGKIVEFHYQDKKAYEGIIYNEKLDFTGSTEIQTVGFFDFLNRIETSASYNPAQAMINYLLHIHNGRYPAYQLTADLDNERFLDSGLTGVSNGGSIVKKLMDTTGFDFYLGVDRVAKFKKEISNKTHYLTFGEKGHITKGTIGQNMNNYKSYVQVISEYNGTTYNTYKEDPILNELYGKANKLIREDGLSPSAITVKLNEGIIGPQKKTQLELDYCDLNILPGDYLTITNAPVKIEKVKIVKVDYTLHSTIIYLDLFENIYTNLKS